MIEILKTLFFIIIFTMIFIVTRFTIKTYFKFTINKKLYEIFPSNDDDKEVVKSKTFKYIYDFDKTFTVDNFKSVKLENITLKIVQWGSDGFKIYANGDLIISRKCLKGFYYTKNGCSRTRVCVNKQEGDMVADNQHRNIIYTCDGLGGVKDVILDKNLKKLKDISIETNTKSNPPYGNCDSEKSIPIHIPEFWSSSAMYKQCVHNFWNFKFCPKTQTNDSYFNVLQEIRNELDDGILYRPPNVDTMVFDENDQKCIPFDYRKHYKNGLIPLMYNDDLMFEQSSVLPNSVYYNSITKKIILQKNNSAEYIGNVGDYNSKDIEECKIQYQEYTKNIGEFLGVLTVAYSNVILSCRYGKPVNKVFVDKNKNTAWGRNFFGENSYSDGVGNINICKDHLHRFIPTCVEDIECVNVDSLIPFKPPSVSITETFDISFCSSTGRLQHVLKEKLELDKFCAGYKTNRVHPYYNIPIDCKNRKIIKGMSHRDPSFKTLKIKNDSIFKHDFNALNLHFFSRM